MSIAFMALMAIGLLGCSAKPAPEVLFPNATQVEVYGAPAASSITVDRQGHVRASGLSKDHTREEAYPATNGGRLTPLEISTLRATVHFTHPPNEVAACCVPRHAFLFFDRSGRYLGYLKVCFECGCAEMEPFRPPSRERNWISWDYRIVRQIVVAHGLTPIDDEDH
ncbi:MAG: hypothetical protein P4L73_11340 [Caulobacteraceae bacterium]|nr:hypothetical protein [Caulobacteraceae bacterium]